MAAVIGVVGNGVLSLPFSKSYSIGVRMYIGTSEKVSSSFHITTVKNVVRSSLSAYAQVVRARRGREIGVKGVTTIS